MASPLVVAHAIALAKSLSGEKFQQIQFLSTELGIVRCMIRQKANKDATQIDLFDQGEIRIELKESSNTGFLKEFDLTIKRNGIGSSYQRLEAASRFSKFLLANPVHEMNAFMVFDLAQKAFDALDKGMPANAVLLKSIYLYCRDEGYPVLEDWAQNLETSLHKSVAAILNTPLAKIDLSDQEQSNALESLLTYTKMHTHIYIS